MHRQSNAYICIFSCMDEVCVWPYTFQPAIQLAWLLQALCNRQGHRTAGCWFLFGLAVVQCSMNDWQVLGSWVCLSEWPVERLLAPQSCVSSATLTKTKYIPVQYICKDWLWLTVWGLLLCKPQFMLFAPSVTDHSFARTLQADLLVDTLDTLCRQAQLYGLLRDGCQTVHQCFGKQCMRSPSSGL